MPVKVFADELQGPAWARVRAIRKENYGNSGEPLDSEVVPEGFHHLMPYASLLTTGEEPALEEFFDALDGSTRDALMSALEPLVEQLRAYGLDGPEALQGRELMPPEAPLYSGFSAQELSEILTIDAACEMVSARLKMKGPSPPEQVAMLDLARFYDLNEERSAPAAHSRRIAVEPARSRRRAASKQSG